MPFMKLDQNIQKAIQALGYTSPTPIQLKAIPPALEGHDILASAQTGTGKTAAFVLPILQHLLTAPTVKGHGPRTLILTPTRELAMQVSEVIKGLSRFTSLKSGAIVGGVPYPQQERLLRQPLDILVATPGRFMDHVRRCLVDFSRIEKLVLDEADRMLDMGFVDEVESIVKMLPKKHQTLFFSATFNKGIDRIVAKILKNPVRIEIAPMKDGNKRIKQQVYKADNLDHKQALLSELLKSDELSKVIVFVSTKRSTETLAKFLIYKGHSSAALNGDMRQSARSRIVKELHDSKLKVLVATNVAARGLDVKGVTHVINFDLPADVEEYIHRIGRTGRQDADGIAISFVDNKDRSKLVKIEQFLGKSIEKLIIKNLEPSSKPQAFIKAPGRSMPPRREKSKGYGNRSSSVPFHKRPKQKERPRASY
ncbi:MAG: DEAD/DEAH box helicase [Alphaproteobacteria bacterium]|nr:DEAD/DEAH box helicase [Alphaproteobacteria bacterium]